jgi:hypothetical protein
MIKYNSFPHDIQILTSKGFVDISKINNKDFICIKNKNGFMEWRNVKHITKHQYNGEVYNLVNNDIDLYVLPDFKIQLDNKMTIGIDHENIYKQNIPKWIGWRCNKLLYTSENWIEFLAYFHCSGRIVNNSIIIDNIYKKMKLHDVLLKMPFKYEILNCDSIIIYDDILLEYIKRFHFNGNKLKIPDKLKISSVMQILTFLKILFNNNWKEFCSSDFDYISDIQHLTIKSGGNANIYSRKVGEYRLIHVESINRFPKPIYFNNCNLEIYQMIFELDYIPGICIRKNGKVIMCNTGYYVD